MSRPIVELQAAGQRLTGPEAALVQVHCDLSVGRSHDWVVLVCTSQSSLMEASLGDDVTLDLGYESEGATTVLTGTVSAIEYQSTGVAIEVLAATAALSIVHHAGSYLQQNVGDIVTDLTSQAKVGVGTVDASQPLAVYHVDELRSVWSHIVDLAALGDYSLSTNASGALELRAPKSRPVEHTFRYGAELLLWHAGPQRAEEIAWQGTPHGAASEAGSDKWHILLQDPTGGSPQAPSRVLAAARDRETADAYTQAQQARQARRQIHGRAVVLGEPRLRAGDVVELVDFTQHDNITARCRAVRHRMAPDTGFITHLVVEAAA